MKIDRSDLFSHILAVKAVLNRPMHVLPYLPMLVISYRPGTAILNPLYGIGSILGRCVADSVEECTRSSSTNLPDVGSILSNLIFDSDQVPDRSGGLNGPLRGRQDNVCLVRAIGSNILRMITLFYLPVSIITTSLFLFHCYIV